MTLPVEALDVSVLVPAKDEAPNLPEFLRLCAEALGPAGFSFEVVIVNDGSRDRTSDIARAHPRVRVVDIPNGGLSNARNVGLSHATGEIVAYTDAICSGVTAIPWPIGTVPMLVPYHCSSGRRIPSDSPGNPTPVPEPYPNRRSILYRRSRPTMSATLMVPTLEERASASA